ncbi:SGNH/GDSL hydrolase family protein [Myceligenerans crystallogenes]|uniref:SGNH/GDSL hydrolase family protein n=1 Tax=Myceligenerans crystallogenes TaxID=316335 RepID=A0ABN2NAS7_9MICO
MKRPALLLATSAALACAMILTGTAAGSSATPAPAAVTDQVHTVGRVKEAPLGTGPARAAFSWPGVSFEGRFKGTAVGIDLDDGSADYDVQIDGRTVRTLVTPGAGVHWIEGLPYGRHTVRVVKRGESPWATSSFGGLVPAAGGRILPRPAPRARQIEFIGDSHTAGYGLESTTRECTGDDVNRTTNADRTFGALTARALRADHQLNAISGRGMVRNYNGGEPGTSYRTYYDRALLAVDGDVWERPASWNPQLVVVGLGVNDFSTPLHDGEEWAGQDDLIAAYTEAYHDFLDRLRGRYPDADIVVTATDAGPMVATTRQIVADRNAAGDADVTHWHYGAGLDLMGCHWHPSAADHELMADRLQELVATLDVPWPRTRGPVR